MAAESFPTAWLLRCLDESAGVRREAAADEELLVLGALAQALSPDDLTRSLDRTVEILRQQFAADDCELFLREPGQGDLVLASCCGRDRDVLMERLRFPLGIGYPGIAAAEGRPVVTHELAQDVRFLRHEVVKRGVRSFVSIPLAAPAGPLGCVDLAWLDPQVDLERAVGLLLQCAGTIATTVRAGLAELRACVDRIVDAEPDRPQADRRQAFLEMLVRAAGARTGLMTSCATHRGEAADPEVVAPPRAPSIPPAVLRFCGRDCPILRSGHAASLGSQRTAWPGVCRRLPGSLSAPCCLPLRLPDRLWGAIVLDYGRSAPTPLTRDLVQLLSMAQQGAIRLASGDGQSRADETQEKRGLEVRCLGGFEVKLNGRQVTPAEFKRKKARALLKILVLRAGDTVGRDELVELLWPGVGPDAGTNRLHGVVHALRSAIEPYDSEGRRTYVRSDGDQYHFDMEAPHWIDLHEFRREAACASLADRERRGDQAIEHAERALDVYRGDLFADDPSMDWCGPQRKQLQDRYLDLLSHIAEHRVAHGDVEQGIALLRRGLTVNPCREDLHQALIQTLADFGRRREALEQYQVCVRALREELGVEPLPATLRLERLLTRLEGHASA